MLGSQKATFRQTRTFFFPCVSPGRQRGFREEQRGGSRGRSLFLSAPASNTKIGLPKLGKAPGTVCQNSSHAGLGVTRVFHDMRERGSEAGLSPSRGHRPSTQLFAILGRVKGRIVKISNGLGLLPAFFFLISRGRAHENLK